RRGRQATGATALLWLGPSLVLIGGVVLYPAYKLAQASLSRFSITGLYQGSAGLRNYTTLLHQDALPTVLLTTLVWVVSVGAVTTGMPAMIAVGVFVSLPFTTYVFLAGLQALPTAIVEAASVDGYSGPRVYRSLSLPRLRPALLVAVVLNMIYVFNSFTSIW